MSRSVTIRPVTSPAETHAWDARAGHPLQSWAWGTFRAAMGVDILRLGRYQDGKITAVCQGTFHRVPHTPLTIGYVPKGSLPDDAFITALRDLGKEKNAIFIQMEPDAIVSPVSFRLPKDLVSAHHPLFTKYTFVLDLTKSETELLAAMHPKTRYNIRVAQKHQVTVKEDSSDEAFAAYLSLSAQTTERQGFYAHNTAYHQTMWETMRRAGIAHLFTAIYQQTPIAAWILFVWKKKLFYPYGASSRQHRETMAPTLMLWETARWGKAQGLTSYDLWGSLGPDPDPKDPWYGFHRFKQGFAPDLVESVGSFDLILGQIPYRLYTVADRIRWQWLRLRR